jgi:NitT/TauT family transport system permease protein
MRRRWQGPLLTLVLLLVLWESIRRVFSVPEILLPSVSSVLEALRSEPRFLMHCAVTLSEAVAGFLVGNLLAVVTAVVVLRWPRTEGSLMPYAIALKTTPIAAIAPILVLWFGGAWASKAAASAAVCFFPSLVGLVRGLRLVDARDYQDYRDLFACWGVGWWNTLLHLRGPFALPLFFASLKVSSSLALVGAVVGEFIAADAGIGYLVVIHSRRLETPQMFAAVFVSAALGVAWFYLIAASERLLSRRFGTLASAEEGLS